MPAVIRHDGTQSPLVFRLFPALPKCSRRAAAHLRVS